MAGTARVLLVGVGLLAFTTLSFLLARHHLERWGLVLALAIAAIKVGLIASFYMHLLERPGGPRLVFATSFIFVIILVGLVLLEAGDRARPTMPPGPFQPLLLPALRDTRQVAPPREPPSERGP
ncbi:cytochrome C oxidase subunit IV family protein [Myxococcus sp. Y35]|uniref:cytochrome C oxidase subunit IV family protein n=1 Tax=Pseudomyxococcus flavus TaxID=3115648 RepID=UPI003CEC7DB0